MKHQQGWVEGLPEDAAWRRRAPAQGYGEPADTQDARTDQRIAQLEHALATRPRVEHAVGILMALASCDVDAAVRLLKQVSQRTNTKMVEVSDLIVANVGGGQPLPVDIADALRLVLPPAPRPRG